jgi:hypothetical protein
LPRPAHLSSEIPANDGRVVTPQGRKEGTLRRPEVAASALFVRDEPRQADLALVFGHSDPDVSRRRARHAAALFHQGFARLLLLCGGPHATADGTPEADGMARQARALGVPEGAILLERTSRSTYDNVRNALALLREGGLLPGVRTMLLVSCPWHMRRVLLLARYIFPSEVRLLCCPHQECCTEQTWPGSPECRGFIRAELRLLARLAGES